MEIRKIRLFFISSMLCFVCGNIIGQIALKNSSLYEVRISNAEQFTIKSKIALGKDFIIKIFVPPSYAESSNKKYPVLYLTDGDTFFSTSTELVNFVHFLDPQIIVVGICYGSITDGFRKRGADFAPYPDEDGIIGAELYNSFIKNELIPFVETKYRIDSMNRTLFGWSAGGRFALFVLFHDTGLFKNYLVFGAPLANRNRWAFRMEEKYFHSNRELNGRLCLGIGEYDEYGYTDNIDFYEILKSRMYKGLEFDLEILRGFRHEYRTAVALLELKLRHNFHGEDIIPIILNTIKEQGIDEAILLYKSLIKENPNNYNLGESQLNNVGYYLLRQGNIEEAIIIFKLNVGRYPQNWNVYDSLGEGYLLKGDKKQAIENYEKALDLCPNEQKNKIENQIIAIKSSYN